MPEPEPKPTQPIDGRSDGSFSIGSDVWPGLSKAIEEAGEFLQVCGKIIATHGAAAHWDGSDLRERFLEEAADVQAGINFVLDMNFTRDDKIAVAKRFVDKYALFVKWQREQTAAPDDEPEP